MSLPTYSKEQHSVIMNLENNNVLVDSVAGSGKTTCNLHIATYYENKNILLLTYNAKLKLETREKVKNLGLKNMTVHTYHSFCVKNYDNKCFNDTIINKLLKNNTKRLDCYDKITYDIIIIDEAQDVTPLYYELICKIYKDTMNKNTKICILGDRYQSIYDFNNADERYIVFAPILFNFNKSSWLSTTLSESFRITDTMAKFINRCILKKDRIISNKMSTFKPRYIICDTFGSTFNKFARFSKNKVLPSISVPFSELEYYLSLGYKPEDIFILAPSVKSDKSAIRQLENKIKTTLKNINIYIPVSDEEKLDVDILKNKLVFSTFHQAKGLERKVVMIFSFDNSYFKYFKKDKNPVICPNEIYVASTRALEHLTLFHHYQEDYFKFLNKLALNDSCVVINHKKVKVGDDNSRDDRIIKTSVTDIIKHLPSEVLDVCFDYLKITNVRKESDIIDIPIKTDQGTGSEGVGEITGTAIPSYFEYMMKMTNTKHSLSILEELNRVVDVSVEDGFVDDNTMKEEYDINDIYKKVITNKKKITESELLYIANKWCAYKSGFIFKTYQITKYNWLSKENLDKCLIRLNTLNISNKAIFEGKLMVKDRDELGNREIVGYFDCMDGNKMYELKCVKELTKEHYIQVALYMYLYEINKGKMNVNIQIGDMIKYIDKSIDLTMSGKVLRIFKNGNIDVMNIMNKVDKIRHDDIIMDNNEMEYYLYNILTDEMNKVEIESSQIINFIKFLIDSKYNKRNEKTDENFKKENHSRMIKYLS